MTNPFADNSPDDRKVNVADLFKGAKLISLLANLALKGLLKWDSERELACVGKANLTQQAGSTPVAQGQRSWLISQGFRGGVRRTTKNFYLSLADLEERGVTIVDGKAQVCEPKVRATATPKEFDATNPFALGGDSVTEASL